ncbi:MAG TPA: HipA domain-containing protein [Cytophagaceae bacterium]|nr:HipA domain-containing protein [Cytophagaceae bacterium]
MHTDLEEFWRRVVCQNTDDHLRYHAFLLTESGWGLSPAYDINPNEFGSGLSLNISEKANSLDLELAVSVAEYFRVNKSHIRKIIDQVKATVSEWRSVAKE